MASHVQFTKLVLSPFILLLLERSLPLARLPVYGAVDQLPAARDPVQGWMCAVVVVVIG